MRQLFNPKGQSSAYSMTCWLSQVPVKQLSEGAKILYARLTRWSDSDGHAFRSAKQLAPELGLGYRAVEKRIQELKNVGLIGTYQPQKGGLNHFEFYIHEWMSAPIHKNLCYESDPPHDHVVPTTQTCGTPPHDHVVISSINLNKENKTRSNSAKAVLVHADTLKKYEIKVPREPREVDNEHINKAVALLSERSIPLTLDEYLGLIRTKYPKLMMPYPTANGGERRNGFEMLLRPKTINDVLTGKWKERK